MLMEILEELTLTCSHRHVGWPQYNRQRCLDCGGTRFYDLQQGIRGEWISPERPKPEAQLQLATTVPEKGNANLNAASLFGWPAVHGLNVVTNIEEGAHRQDFGHSSDCAGKRYESAG